MHNSDLCKRAAQLDILNDLKESLKVSARRCCSKALNQEGRECAETARIEADRELSNYLSDVIAPILCPKASRKEALMWANAEAKKVEESVYGETVVEL